eukprot:623910-Amphidinium_carterae.1
MLHVTTHDGRVPWPTSLPLSPGVHSVLVTHLSRFRMRLVTNCILTRISGAQARSFSSVWLFPPPRMWRFALFSLAVLCTFIHVQGACEVTYQPHLHCTIRSPPRCLPNSASAGLNSADFPLVAKASLHKSVVSCRSTASMLSEGDPNKGSNLPGH